MIDINHDGVINCQDYALYNGAKLKANGIEYGYVLTPRVNPKHIFVMFRLNGRLYAMYNDRLIVLGK